MELTHTSPTAITTIHEEGLFGSFLFFSHSEYVMTAGAHIAYSIDIDEDKIIDAERLFYHEDAEKLDRFVEEVMKMVGCDEDTAEKLIEQRDDVHSIDSDIDPEDLAETAWSIQRITAEAARDLGFRAVAMNDEQGRAYMIDMLGRESDLHVV